MATQQILAYEQLADLIVRQLGGERGTKTDAPGTGARITFAGLGPYSYISAEKFIKTLENAGILKDAQYPDNGLALRSGGEPFTVTEGVTLHAPRGSHETTVTFDNPLPLKDLAKVYVQAVRDSVKGNMPYEMVHDGRADPVIEEVMSALTGAFRTARSQGKE